MQFIKPCDYKTAADYNAAQYKAFQGSLEQKTGGTPPRMVSDQEFLKIRAAEGCPLSIDVLFAGALGGAPTMIGSVTPWQPPSPGLPPAASLYSPVEPNVEPLGAVGAVSGTVEPLGPLVIEEDKAPPSIGKLEGATFAPFEEDKAPSYLIPIVLAAGVGAVALAAIVLLRR